MDRIKSISNQVLEEHKSKFGESFTDNKKILEQVSIIRSKGLKNEIAGYITKFIKKEIREEKTKKAQSHHAAFTEPIADTETPAPETAQPETPAPETAQPETPAPETAQPETPAPETAQPETPAPETAQPETPAPETAQPETPAPETQTSSENTKDSEPNTT